MKCKKSLQLPIDHEQRTSSIRSDGDYQFVIDEKVLMCLREREREERMGEKNERRWMIVRDMFFSNQR